MDAVTQKPHAICIPYPTQSHIKAMLKLAKLLHSQGIQITFVNTEYNHNRFLKSGGPDSLAGLPDFRFETIPDGLPPSDSDSTQNLVALCESIQINCLDPFLCLLEKIPPATCIVSDGFMKFTIDAGEKLGIPVVLFWTIAACAFMGFFHCHDLMEKGFTPLKGFIEINSDGSTFGNHGWAAYGGLARDDRGRWIEGFCGRIGYGTPLQAELWGIRRAMKLANERAWLEAIIETDSLTAVNLINKEKMDNHPEKTLIEDCKNLKEAMLIDLIHVHREGNKCADYLSKLGRVQWEQNVRIMVPTNELFQFLKADMQGVAYPRGV